MTENITSNSQHSNVVSSRTTPLVQFMSHMFSINTLQHSSALVPKHGINNHAQYILGPTMASYRKCLPQDITNAQECSGYRSGLADLALVPQKTELTRSQEKAITRYTHSNQDISEGNLVLLNTDFKNRDTLVRKSLLHYGGSCL